jgi:hypothetical protein
MLLDRLKPYLTREELGRIVAEARSPHRQINPGTVNAASPVCFALERAAIDRNVPRSNEKVPRRILQFWDQETIPEDVDNCMATWRAIPGFEQVVFHEEAARDFIRAEYGLGHLEAYDLCNHPAMKSDLFRLAYLYRHGGVYIDADDAYAGSGMDRLFREDGLLKLRTASFKKDSSMHPVTVFNNNPISCVANDEIIRRALERATRIIRSLGERDNYNILLVTGPVNLSIALYTAVLDCIARNTDLRFSPIVDWDDIAKKNTNLEYQKTRRNWRVTE